MFLRERNSWSRPGDRPCSPPGSSARPCPSPGSPSSTCALVGLALAVAEVGKRVGAISSSLQGSLILAAIATGLAGPYLARIILPRTAPHNQKPGEAKKA